MLPHHAGLRPRWMLRLGLFIYDHLGGRGGLEGAESLDLTRDEVGKPLKSQYKRGFAYTDCQTDDARLVVSNAMDARARGADIRVRTRVQHATRDGGLWRLTVEDEAGAVSTVTARALVNATGPWVNDTLELAAAGKPSGVRLVQGSHIVTKEALRSRPRLHLPERRPPHRLRHPLAGRVHHDRHHRPGTGRRRRRRSRPARRRIAYLCKAVDEYFERSVTPDDVVWAWSGVRALADDGASEAREATRDYVLSLDAPAGEAALLSVYGGKITT